MPYMPKICVEGLILRQEQQLLILCGCVHSFSSRLDCSRNAELPLKPGGGYWQTENSSEWAPCRLFRFTGAGFISGFTFAGLMTHCLHGIP